MSEHARSFGRSTPPHGTMAEEAAKLVDVAHLWLASQSAQTGTDDVWADATAEPEETAPPECAGCPYCRLRRALSDVNPEVYTHLADAVSSLGAALRSLDGSRQHDGRR